MNIPQWFIDALESDSDKKLSKEGKLKALDRVVVCCHKCGKRIETVVKSKLVPVNLNNPDYKIMCKRCAQRNSDDIIGKRFGKLVVIKELDSDMDDENHSRHRRVLCQCDCGKLVTPFLKNLRRGISTSCGKHKSEKTVIPKEVIEKANKETLEKISESEMVGKDVVRSKAKNCTASKRDKPIICNSDEEYMESKDIIKEFGFIRETSDKAKEAGIDKATGICRTGLEEYLEVIYPGYDWIHDKALGIIDGVNYRTRPDYRCEEHKIIVEFDGLLHYSNPEQILKDRKNTEIYESLGYKVIRIPYFIQLTNKNVEKLFGVKVYMDLFPVGVSSLNIELKNTPAYLCVDGIKRMAEDFMEFPDDYEVNINYLKSLNSTLSGVEYLEYFYNKNIHQ